MHDHYIGCDCNYDLCKSQREKKYEKWKWFDICLNSAIKELSIRTSGKFDVYTGLSNVKMDRKVWNKGYFPTYVSTSWRKEVAQHFVQGNEGMIIKIDESYRNDEDVYWCDVSWISKFPDECEILFSRDANQWVDGGGFSCKVMDESNGVQTVLLTSRKRMYSYGHFEIPIYE